MYIFITKITENAIILYMITEIFAAAFVIMLTSLSGVLFVWNGLGNFIQKYLRYLVTLAMGVFATTLFFMFKETAHMQVNLLSSAFAAALGALTLEVLQRYLPEAHHHHGADEDECCKNKDKFTHLINPRRVLLGDAAHNISDGILLVPAFLIDLRVGIVATIGILVHEFVQEISEFFILKGAGYTNRQALVRNFAVSSTILIGVVLSLVLARAGDFVPLLISFAAGGFIYIIVRDLLPHTLAHIRHSGGAFVHIVAFAIGIAIMFATTLILPHSHEHNYQPNTEHRV